MKLPGVPKRLRTYVGRRGTLMSPRSMTLVGLCLALMACITPMPRAQLEAMPYGKPPAADYPRQINSHLKTVLKDPDSLRYGEAPGRPEKAYACPYRSYPEVDSAGKEVGRCSYGWMVTFTYNAKNSYGGYAGETMAYAFFINQKIAFICSRSDIDSCIRTGGIPKPLASSK